MIDCYKVLGVSHDVDQVELRRAFRRKARKYHPDLNKKPGANDKFVQVNEAYQTLSDPTKRTAFNLDWRQANPSTRTTTKQRTEQTRARREPAPNSAGNNNRQANEEFEQFYQSWQYHPPDQASSSETKTTSEAKSKNPSQPDWNPQAKASSRPRQAQRTRTSPVAKKHFLTTSWVMLILAFIPAGVMLWTALLLLHGVSEGMFVQMSRDFYIIGISLFLTAFLLALSYLTS